MRSRVASSYISAITFLEVLSIVLLFVDLGLRGGLTREENWRLFWTKQVNHFSYHNSLVDVVLLTCLRSLITVFSAVYRRKITWRVSLVQSSVGFLYAAAKSVFVSAWAGHSEVVDNLQWALLLFSAGYSSLQVFMSILARQRRHSYKPSEDKVDNPMFTPNMPSLPAERLASANSRFARLLGCNAHFKFFEGDTSAPLVVFLPGLGGCAETCSSVVRELSTATDLSIAVLDRPGFGLTERSVQRVPRPLSSTILPDVEVELVMSDDDASESEEFIRRKSVEALPLIRKTVGTKRKKRGGIRRTVSERGQRPSSSPGSSFGKIAPAPEAAQLFTDSFVANMVIALAHLLGYDRVILLAHGDAANIAVQTCARAARLVVAMALISPAVKASELAWNQQLILNQYCGVAPRIYRKWIEQTILRGSYFYNAEHTVTDDLRRAFMTTLRVNDCNAAFRHFAREHSGKEAQRTQELVHRLISDGALVGIPIMVMCGEEDRIVPPSHAVQLSGEVDAVKFQTLRSCGHAPHLERPEPFVNSLLDFLSELGVLAKLDENNEF